MLERRVRADPELAERVLRLRQWQAHRLADTYADLRRDPRLARAVDFFLSDLYGPQDFAPRNDQLARATSHLRRVLPAPARKVLQQAIELDVLTAELDQALAAQPAWHSGATLDRSSYAAAYRAMGRAEDRRRQIELTVAIGAQLERVARQGWVALALRAAHAPAHLAGFGVLQDFLERGLSAFRRMRGAELLLHSIRDRETQLMDALFAARSDAFDIATADSRA